MPPDFDSAFSLMQIEAKKETALLCTTLQRCTFLASAVKRMKEQAQAWFSKAYHAFTAQEAKVKKKDYFQYRIGKLFSFGYGVEQDYGKAAEWYEKAVSEDNPFAVYALGSLYRRGQGVEQNDEKAYELYCVAAEHTEKPNAYAAYELGRMCRDGIGTASGQGSIRKYMVPAGISKGFLMIERELSQRTTSAALPPGADEHGRDRDGRESAESKAVF
ncbi:MAG: tetratricopeptide repeat protein [Clostridia bacterium]